MATQFQHRLVGTIALISIGVIFIPDVFDGEKLHYQNNLQALPLQEPVVTSSTLEEVDVALPDLDALIETLPDVVIENSDNSAEEEVDMSSSDNEVIPVSIPESQAPKKEHLAESAWVIRLGTFRNITNAKKLVSDLRNKGYAASMSPNNPKEGQFVRVEVGPDLSKQKLTEMIQELETITGLKGQLLRFDPLNS